jgi:thioredoxin-dependent peroxiredoxin
MQGSREENPVYGLAISAALCLPAFAALKPGDRTPGFSAPVSLAGRELHFSLRAALKKGPVVVYFYPSAFTGGCVLDAHTFAQDGARDSLPKVTRLEITLNQRWPR